MINVFVDSNIWLSLYAKSNDDVERFEILYEMINKQILLYLPEQVIDEVWRNRDAKIKDALKGFEMQRITYPVYCKNYPEYESFYNDYEGLLKRFKNWEDHIKEDIGKLELPADKIIKKIFGEVLSVQSKNYADAAYRRYQIGNPPGKDNRYGDAINWECLLGEVPYGEDIVVISNDLDYRSKYDDSRFNLFLEMEWREKKNAKVHYYRYLRDFIKDYQSYIEKIIEDRKEKLIKDLAASSSFSETHFIISKMDTVEYVWNDDELEKICEVVEKNRQVGKIIDDNDINEFFWKQFFGRPYNRLPDCATKRVMKYVLGEAADDNQRIE